MTGDLFHQAVQAFVQVAAPDATPEDRQRYVQARRAAADHHQVTVAAMDDMIGREARPTITAHRRQRRTDQENKRDVSTVQPPPGNRM